MDLRDARRLAVSCLVLAGLVVLWLLFLALDDAKLFQWGWPHGALQSLRLATWQWIGASTLAVLVCGLTGIVFGLGVGGQSPTRQVQCEECRAVFFIPDNGRRPLTHTCPNCKAFGVYDGKRPAADGPLAEEARPIPRSVPLGRPSLHVTCPACHNPFQAADDGKRPLAIQCPKCGNAGTVR